jgi:hypothetical protein
MYVMRMGPLTRPVLRPKLCFATKGALRRHVPEDVQVGAASPRDGLPVSRRQARSARSPQSDSLPRTRGSPAAAAARHRFAALATRCPFVRGGFASRWERRQRWSAPTALYPRQSAPEGRTGPAPPAPVVMSMLYPGGAEARKSAPKGIRSVNGMGSGLKTAAAQHGCVLSR